MQRASEHSHVSNQCLRSMSMSKPYPGKAHKDARAFLWSLVMFTVCIEYAHSGFLLLGVYHQQSMLLLRLAAPVPLNWPSTTNPALFNCRQ